MYFYQLTEIDPVINLPSEVSACVTSNNPCVYFQLSVGGEVLPPPPTIEFGIFDREASPLGDWIACDITTLTNYWSDFVDDYNNGGILIIDDFQSGNCCIALASGDKLDISGSTYGFQFPADVNNVIQCNPVGGYTGGDNMYFYQLTEIDPVINLPSGVSACSTSHNPCIYYRVQ
tara:strand:- start:192 stop:716 length:525 start_codon:yes stop_codon:yes gene_type:complete